ncbi:RNA polymerase I-specific transcription-initiation factor domain-containing protein [Trichoderma aethiopicum]
MADWWPHPLMGLGTPGVLNYIPSEHPGEEPGLLETSRFTSRCPHFKVIGAPIETYSASRSQLPESSTRLWEERQTQQRWLFKFHPDIAFGNTAYQDILKEDMAALSLSDEAPNTRPLLAIGHVPDPSDKTGIRKLPITAVACGEAGELLRLARMEDVQLQWGDDADAFLNIETIDPTQRDAEAIWTNDGLPIRQIKFAGNRLQDDTLRWLLLQKETATTIFRPELREVPTTSDQPKGSLIRERPSLIKPNPLLTISHDQTGGSPHSDVALLTTTHGRSHQLAIIDEGGYWSIWDLIGAWQVQRKGAPQYSLSKCGHISDGLLNELPTRSSFPSERHGILFLEGVWHGKIESSPSASARKATDPNTRYLLMWNHERMEVLNLDTNIFLPRLGRIMRQRGKLDWILDIHRSPTRQNHVFILTQYHITWVDVFGRDESGLGPLKPSVLLSCPHLGTKKDDSRMFVCRASDDDPDTSLVFIYYPRMGQLCIFWFTYSPVTRMPQWHRDIISLPGSEEREFPAKNVIEYLRVDPVQLAVSVKANPSSPGIDYHRRGVRFYQLTFLGRDFSLQRCLCVTIEDPTLDIQEPTSAVAWAEARQQKQREKRRRVIMSQVSSSFILPDEMTMDDVEALLNGEEVEDEEDFDGDVASSALSRPTRIRVDQIYQALQGSLEASLSQGESGLPSQLFEALRQCLSDGFDQGRLPLLTWREVAETMLRDSTFEPPDETMRDEMERLLDENNEKTIVTPLYQYNRDEMILSLASLQYFQRYFAELWIDPVRNVLSEDMHQIRRIWVTELARDVFLSSYGIMYQDIPLLGPASSELPEEESQRSRAGLQFGSSQIATSSRSSSRDWASSPAQSPAASTTFAGPDEAVQRLRLLAKSIDTDKTDASRRSNVLAYWPKERGVDLNEYVSSVARANEELFRDAKERLQRMEARRKARSEKFRRPAFMRQGLPDINPMNSMAPTRPAPMQIMSSQGGPEATQTQVPVMTTMSQPVSGLFGDRKKVKKKQKKKLGFR